MTLSRHVDRMEAAGLVERRQDPHDRRARQLFTTEKSRELLHADARSAPRRSTSRCRPGSPRTSAQALHRGLETIIANLCATERGADTDNADRSGSEKEIA